MSSNILLELQNLLEVNRFNSDESEGKVATHLSYGKLIRGVFMLDKKTNKQFMKLYKQCIKEGHQLSILEKRPELGPIIIDIDINYNKLKDNGRLYNDKIIKNVIKCYTEAINSLCISEASKINEDEQIYLFEKSEPTNREGIYKDGFHLIIPNIIYNKNERYKIRDEAIKYMKEYKIFDEYINDNQKYEELDDKAVIFSNGWFLYGSSKPGNYKPYKLTNVYNSKGNIIFDEEELQNENIDNLIDGLSLYQNKYSKRKYKPQIITSFADDDKQDKTSPIKQNNNDDTKYNKIDFIVSNLSNLRSSDYQDWIKVKFGIYNELDKAGYKIFDNFSSKCKSKYKEEETKKEYFKSKKKDTNGITIKTLLEMLQKDNPTAFTEYLNKYKSTTKTTNDDYTLIKKQFETSHFKVMSPLTYGCIYNNQYTTKTKTDLINTYENMYYKTTDIEGNIKKNQFIKNWLKDESMRTVLKVDFLPMQESEDNIYNLFDGLEINKYNNCDDLTNEELNEYIYKTKLYEHIYNLCGEDPKVRDYFIKWLANIVIKPYDKSRVALIFKSEEGCGKDTFFNWFGDKILGSKYYINDSSVDLFFGRFNGVLSRKLLVCINETDNKDTKDILGKLKDAITKNTNKIENKGCPVYEEQNNISYVFLTNNELPVKIDPKNRRYLAIESNPMIANDEKYFNKLYQELKDDKLSYYFYKFLLNQNIKDYDFSNNRPTTKYNNLLIERNIPILALFLGEELIDNNKYDEIGSYEFFNIYKYYLDKNGHHIDVNNTKLGLDLKIYDGINKIKNNYIKYKFDKKKLKQFLIKKKYYIEYDFIDE